MVGWEEGRYTLLGRGRIELGTVGRRGGGRVDIVLEARCTQGVEEKATRQ